jgi:hypothetical protein
VPCAMCQGSTALTTNCWCMCHVLQAPYLQGDLQYLMPHHTVNVSPDKVGLADVGGRV